MPLHIVSGREGHVNGSPRPSLGRGHRCVQVLGCELVHLQTRVGGSVEVRLVDAERIVAEFHSGIRKLGVSELCGLRKVLAR